MRIQTPAAPRKEGGRPINIDFLKEFVHSSSSSDRGGDDVCFVTPPPAARKGKGNAAAGSAGSPGCSVVYPVSPDSAPAKGKRGREEAEWVSDEDEGMSNEAMLRDIADMSDGELRRQIAGLSAFAGNPGFESLLSSEKRRRRKRMLPLLEEEARRRQGIRTGAAAKGGGDRNRGSRFSEKDVYSFDLEDELEDNAAHKYCRNSTPIRPMDTNYGRLGVQTRRSYNQTGRMNPISVDKMYSSKTSPTAFGGHKLRVRAVDPKEHDKENSRQNENNNYRNNAKRRKAHQEDSSFLHQKVNDVVLLDEEDVQPDEPVDCGLLEKWKELKIYYPSSDDPEAVELSSSDIKCLNPGVYLSSPVINYYIQYIKRDKMHIEYGIDKFYMFNTYFYGKLQEALLDKGKFLKLRRWWKGVNIFQRGYIILPIHGTSHWSLIIVCMPAKESNSGPIILHLDSLGMHPSAEIFDTVGRYLEEEWLHLRKNPHSDISVSETIGQDIPWNIHKEKVEVPGQNNAYDCGVFMLYYIQQFIKEAPERFTRDSLDMFSRSWFRSEVASDLRKEIRKLLLELFGNARADDNMLEAAASNGTDEECIIKEGESEVVTPCDSSGMAVGGVDTSTRNEADFMEIRSLEGTPSTTRISDGRIVACALSEAAMLSDSIDGDDTMKTDFVSSKTEKDIEILPPDGSGMAVGGGGTSTRNEEDFIEVRSLEGTASTTHSIDDRIIPCALSEAATLSDSIDDDDTRKTDSDSSKTEQDTEILPSDRSKNNEAVIHSTPDPTMYCPDSDVEEVKTPEVEKRKRKSKFCHII